MTNIKHTAYVDQLCPRCGSKRFISKKWKEKIPTYFGSFVEVEYSQIDCTNVACQKEFDMQQKEEAEKREQIKTKKEANSLKAAKDKPATKRSRI